MDEVVIGAPYSLTDSLLDHFKVGPDCDCPRRAVVGPLVPCPARQPYFF